MTATVRYKNVTNTSNPAVVLTSDNVPVGDGSDKLYREVRRDYATIDIGAAAGKTQNAGGCIIDTLPAGTKVLVLEGCSFKVTAGASRSLDNLTLAAGAQIASLSYSVDANNNVIVVDAGNNAAVQLAAGDYTIVKLTLGPS